MKTQRRRGFTVVELVVVIAIIAVLAAVLIPTFTSIIKKANDSAALQERTNQRLEDIAQKVDNANWLSWEDFEGKLAEELAKVGGTDSAAIQAAVTAAMEQYQASHGTPESGITKEQVETIVKQAISKQGALTTAQVEAVVKEAIANGAVSGVSEATVRQIVNAAVAGIPKQTGVTKPEMQKAITEALKGVSSLDKSEVEAIVKQALAGFNTISESQVQKIVDDAIAGLGGWVYFVSDITIDNAVKTYVLRTDAPLGTVNITATVTTVKRLIIDAPNVQKVNVNCNVETLEIQRTASTSTHIFGGVDEMIINKGRAVVEAGATVDNLTAAPYANANVIVVIAAATNTKSAGSVGTLNAEYQDNGNGTNDTIEIINAGAVGTANLTASDALEESGTTTTNVQVTNVNQASNSATSADKITEGASAYIPSSAVEVSKAETVEAAEQGSTTTAVSTKVNGDYEARIGSQGYDTLEAAITAAGTDDVVVLLKDINRTSVVLISKSVTINGAGHSINNTANRVIRITAGNLNVQLYNLGVISKCTNTSDVRGISFDGVSSGSTLVLDNTHISASFYAINVVTGPEKLNIVMRNGSVSAGWAAINSYSNNSTYLIENSTLSGLNDKSESSWNNFNTITFDGYCLSSTNIGQNGSNNTMTIKNSTVFASSESGNNQSWIGIQYGALNNTIVVENTTIKDAKGNDQTDNLLLSWYCNHNENATPEWTFYEQNSTITVDNVKYTITVNTETGEATINKQVSLTGSGESVVDSGEEN